MKQLLSFAFVVLTMTLFNSALGQYITHYIEKVRIRIDTLIDKKSGHKYIIDKQRIYITAIDKNGKLLWKTDPVIDNKLPKYRIARPQIIYFALCSERVKKGNEKIWITYNNTQFGVLDKLTGKFNFYGQN